MKEKLLPVTAGVGPPTFEIGSWPKLAMIFKGEKFSADLKSRIEEATRNYLWLAAMESGAPPLTEALSALDRLAESASNLHADITQLTRGQAATGKAENVNYLILHKLSLYLRIPGARPLGDQVRVFLEGLTDTRKQLDKLQSSLRQAKLDVCNDDENSQREGEAWVSWVRNIEAILHAPATGRASAKQATSHPRSCGSFAR